MPGIHDMHLAQSQAQQGKRLSKCKRGLISEEGTLALKQGWQIGRMVITGRGYIRHEGMDEIESMAGSHFGSARLR